MFVLQITERTCLSLRLAWLRLLRVFWLPGTQIGFGVRE